MLQSSNVLIVLANDRLFVIDQHIENTRALAHQALFGIILERQTNIKISRDLGALRHQII